MFKMNTDILNGLSIILIILLSLAYFLIYNDNAITILNDNFFIVMLLYIPYLILHEIIHSISYCIHGAKFKNITYGAHLEKGILCCLCKQNISKKNILFSLLAPFFYLGIITFIIEFCISMIFIMTVVSPCIFHYVI